MIDAVAEKRVTIKDIASQAGVTRATVYLAIRNKNGVSPETRQRVMKIAQQMNYAMFPMRTHHGKVHWSQIGFIIIEKRDLPLDKKLDIHYFNHMIHGCAEYAEEKAHSMVFSRMDWKQVEAGTLASVLKQGLVDGFLFRAWLSPEVEKMLQEINVPIVLIDCSRHLDKYSSVHIDNIKGMDLIVDHLVRQGARRFATITGDMEHQNAQERLAGLQIALTRRGIPLPSEGIIIESDFVDENGRRGIRRLLESGYRFDALVCHFDLAAYGAIEELTSAKIKVPDDIRVTGFDNEPFADKIAIPLTTVETHTDQIGWLGAQLLLAQINNEEPKQILHVHSEVSLVVRKSA